jgi:DNA (cytosine-5)-methyltransferase 1
MYVVFWQKGLRDPDLDIRPRAHCARCSQDIDAVQSWKNPAKPWGKYQQQYLYRCPTCAGEVTPYYYCAANAIDWSLPAPRIGDRARPLKEKTLKRIEIGLKKFGGRAQLVGNYSPGWTRPVTDPTGTVTAADHHSLLTPPFLVQTAHPDGDSTVKQWPVERAMPTQSARAELGLTVPPFLMSVNHSTDRAREVSDPAPAVMPQGNPYLVTPPYLVDLRGENVPKATTDPLSTVCGSGNHHGVVVPFLSSYYGTGEGSPIDAAVPTVPTRDRHALVLAPFLMSYYTRLSGQQAAVSGMDDAVPTVPGRAVHYLAQPGETPAVEDCGFRMLQPHEIQAAMAFPQSYRVVGNQRERVKQLGNAVTPPVMDILIRRCVAVLG